MSNLPNNGNKQKTNALYGMLAATAIWGIAPPIIKSTLDSISPISFLFYRFLIVCIVLLPFMYFKLRKEKLTLKDLPILAVSGVFAQTSLLLIFYGLKFTSSLEVAFIGVIAPLLTIGAGHYFFGDDIGRNTKIGLIITSLGTAVLAIGPILDSNSFSHNTETRILGNALIVLYNLLWAIFVIWSKRLRGEKSDKITKATKLLGISLPRKNYSSSTITGVSFYVGLLTLLPLYIIEASGSMGSSNVFSILDLPYKAWAGIMYMALLSSVIAYGLFEWSLKFLKISDTVIFSYIAPIFTLPAAYLLLSEIPSGSVLIGSFVIVCGIVVAERKPS